ncbi:MAG: DMT family transporter [Pseudomonadota bacterium]
MPPTLFLVLSPLCLSIGSVLAKGLIAGGLPFSIAEIGPLAFLTFQLIGSLIFLGAVGAMRSQPFRCGSAWPLLTIAGLILGLGSIGTVMALVYIPVGEASVIWAMQPFAMIVLAWLLLREPTPMPTILLCIVGVGGVIMIVTSGFQGTAENRLLGSIFAIGTALSAAVYAVWMRQARDSVDPFSALLVVQSSTLVVVICAWAIAANTGLVVGDSAGWWDVFAAMVTGTLYYGLAYILFLFGLQQMEAGKAGMFLNLAPVFTILLALMVLGERLSPMQWIGSAVVIVAVALAGWLNARPVA